MIDPKECENIRKHLENKYNVDLSDVKIEEKWLSTRMLPYYSYKDSTIYLLKTFFLSPFPLIAEGGWCLVNFTHPLDGLIISIPYFILCLLGDLSKPSIISHEYGHAAHMKRMSKYFSLLKNGLDYEVSKRGRNSDDSNFSKSIRSSTLTFKEMVYTLSMLRTYQDFSEQLAVADEENNPFVSSTISKVTDKIINMYYSLSSDRRRERKTIKLMEKINPEKPCPREVEYVLEKIEKSSSLSGKEKKTISEMISEEHKMSVENGFHDWIKNSPAILPEKLHLMYKLIYNKSDFLQPL